MDDTAADKSSKRTFENPEKLPDSQFPTAGTVPPSGGPMERPCPSPRGHGMKLLPRTPKDNRLPEVRLSYVKPFRLGPTVPALARRPVEGMHAKVGLPLLLHFPFTFTYKQECQYDNHGNCLCFDSQSAVARLTVYRADAYVIPTCVFPINNSE